MEREKYYWIKIDEVKVWGDYKEVDNIRYNCYCEEIKEFLECKEWDVKCENLKKS